MRCAKHGLATAEDGQCVLCRRDAQSQRPRPSSLGPSTGPADRSWVGPNLTVLAMLVIVAAGFVASRAIAGLGPTAPPLAQLGRTQNPESDLSPNSGAVPPTNDEIDEATFRAALARVEIHVYYAPWCPACKAARAWLRARDIPYQGFNVERDPSAARRLRELNPASSIPVIEVDDQVMVGFDERRLGAMLRTAVARRQQEL